MSPSLPDYIEDDPRIEEVAKELRMSEDVLYAHLRNQGVYANHGDRLPVWVVFGALDAELEAGRSWRVEQPTRR